MVKIIITPDAQSEFEDLPLDIQVRVLRIFERLGDWPSVSGAKPLRGEWAGHYRIRTGDWRVIFQVISPRVIVVRIKHRREVYED